MRTPTAPLAILLLAGTATARTQTPAPAPQSPLAAQQPSFLGERLGDAGRAITGNPAAGADRDMLRVDV